MEDIKQYGDLTEKELFEFLDEIKSDDLKKSRKTERLRLDMEIKCHGQV